MAGQVRIWEPDLTTMSGYPDFEDIQNRQLIAQVQVTEPTLCQLLMYSGVQHCAVQTSAGQQTGAVMQGCSLSHINHECKRISDISLQPLVLQVLICSH